MPTIVSSEPERSEALGREVMLLINTLPMANRPGDAHRTLWTQWLGRFISFGSNCTKYPHDKCWGNTILRTSYEDDAKFAIAVAAIRRLAMIPILLDYELRGTGLARDQDPPEDDGPEVTQDSSLEVSVTDPILRQMLQDAYKDMTRRAKEAAPLGTRCMHDWVITHELMRRYHNLVVEDRAALECADPAAAWQYFHHRGCEEREHGLRGTMFVLLDKEAIDHLADVPSEEELASMSRSEKVRISWQHWIKVITPSHACTDDGEEIDAIPDDHLALRRIRLFDYIDIYMCLQDLDVMDLAAEGNDRKWFPGHIEREWEFCHNPDGNPDAYPFLTELYGEQVSRWRAH